jgi:hypothetical protein
VTSIYQSTSCCSVEKESDPPLTVASPPKKTTIYTRRSGQARSFCSNRGHGIGGSAIVPNTRVNRRVKSIFQHEQNPTSWVRLQKRVDCLTVSRSDSSPQNVAPASSVALPERFIRIPGQIMSRTRVMRHNNDPYKSTISRTGRHENIRCPQMPLDFELAALARMCCFRHDSKSKTIPSWAANQDAPVPTALDIIHLASSLLLMNGKR